MKHTEIIEYIEKTAPLFTASAWDKSGVQVASFAQSCSHLAVMLDPSLSQITKALTAGADFILTHHPLTMQPQFTDRANDYLAILSQLLGKQAWLYSAHTSLDANPKGPVRWLATALQLQQVQLLEPTVTGEDGAEYGFGFVGSLAAPVSYAEFSTKLATCLGKKTWQACGPMPTSIQKVACCPGSGSGLAADAYALGADILLTGDVKYHAALDTHIRILDVGHFCLEETMMQHFAAHLATVLPIPVTFFPASDPLTPEGC